MKLSFEVWKAFAKFFLSVSQGLILAGIASYILEHKDLLSGIIIILLGVNTLGYGLYLTAIASILKREE